MMSLAKAAILTALRHGAWGGAASPFGQAFTRCSRRCFQPNTGAIV